MRCLLLALSLLLFIGCQTTEGPGTTPPEEPPEVVPPPRTGEPPVPRDTPVARPGQPITLGRHLQGVVLGPGGSVFVAGATVEVRDSRGSRVVVLTTDTQGSFRSEPLSPDRYTLSITDPEGRFFPLTLEEVDPVRGSVEIELERGFHIAGAVQERRSAHSVPGVRVVVESVSDGEEVGATLTAGQGLYRIGPLRPGEYRIRADVEDGDTRDVHLLDDVLRMDLTIPDLVYVNGLVLRSQGPRASPAPLEGARVSFEDAEGQEVATVTTNENGLFTVVAPPPGSYLVQVVEPGGEGRGQVMCVVPEDEEPRPLRVVVQGPAIIGGTIAYPESLAEEDAVRLWLLSSERAEEPLQVAYPTDGRYVFPRGVSPGTYVVRAIIFLPSGEVDHQSTITVQSDEQVEVSFTFQ